MRNLYDGGCVAIVLFYVGAIISHVSDELLQTADVMNIPLILIEDDMKYSVRYSDVIKDVMGAVFYDQISTDSFADAVENRLKQIPYNKRSMETLLNVIAETYNCNLVLYNKNGLYFTSIYKPSFGQFEPEFLGGMPLLTVQRIFSAKAYHCRISHFIYTEKSFHTRETPGSHSMPPVTKTALACIS